MNRKDSVIYDGFELGSDAPVRVIACTSCAATMDLPLSGLLGSFVRWRHVEPALSERLAAAASLAPSEWTGLPELRTRDGFDPYLARLECPRCGVTHAVVLGYGEFQPARYLATVEAIVATADL
ncbi:MAG: hypothetical protein IV100_32465 [Myxococcales bacterium]|nr:hypothetical protein [Myxococcales bacterium]